MIIGALAPAIPETRGRRRQRRQHDGGVLRHRSAQCRPYVYLETLGGGFGGRARKDGTDGVQVHITNTSNLPVEAIEMEYPLLVESYGLVEDSAGPGKLRGGMGLRRAIRPVDQTASSTARWSAPCIDPWGIFGGGSGAAGRFRARGSRRRAAEICRPSRTGSSSMRTRRSCLNRRRGRLRAGLGAQPRGNRARPRERQVLRGLHCQELRSATGCGIAGGEFRCN